MDNREIMESRLKLYLEAEAKILLNQSYTLGNRTYVRADLAKVRSAIQELQEALNSETNAKVKRAVPVDR